MNKGKELKERRKEANKIDLALRRFEKKLEQECAKELEEELQKLFGR